MKSQFRMAAALIMGGLIACTSIAGAADKKADRKAGGPMIQQRVDQLEKDLGLTAEQKGKVQALMETEAKEMRGMRDTLQSQTPEQRREKMMERRKAMDAKMKEILKADQYTKWQEVRKAHGPRPDGKGGEKKDKGQHKGEGKGKKKNG